MKTAYLRVCRLLASSGFREHEIAEFAQQVSQSDSRALLGDVARLRQLMNDSLQGRTLDIPLSTSHSLPSEVEEKIERLLVLDTGLPRSLAVEQLTAVLRLRSPEIDVPSESRKGFRPWIRKLITLVPEKELLHIATSLRNRVVKPAPPDWRLK